MPVKTRRRSPGGCTARPFDGRLAVKILAVLHRAADVDDPRRAGRRVHRHVVGALTGAIVVRDEKPGAPFVQLESFIQPPFVPPVNSGVAAETFALSTR
jgi:hypothetical protein